MDTVIDITITNTDQPTDPLDNQPKSRLDTTNYHNFIANCVKHGFNIVRSVMGQFTTQPTHYDIHMDV
jgi:hypothetical protein